MLDCQAPTGRLTGAHSRVVNWRSNMNFNVWADGQHGKTTITADDMNQALDLFCQRHGFIDYPDYCGEEKPELNIEAVNHADN